MHKMQQKLYLKSILSILFIVCIFTKSHFAYAQCTVEYFEDGTLIDSFPTEETSKTEAAAVELIIYDVVRSPSTCVPFPEDIICAEGCCEYTTCADPFDFLACTDGLYQVTRPIPDPWIASWDVVCEPPSACEINADCDDGLYCTGIEVCETGSCQAGTPACPPFSICDEASSECLCSSDSDCDDGLYCNGVETCNSFSGICDITFDFNVDYPCLDCLPNFDDCDCNEATDSCQPVNLTVGSGFGLPETTDNLVTVSLDTLFVEVAAIQMDVCDVDDNLTCSGCEIAGRTPSEFYCSAVERPDGCCQIYFVDTSFSGAFIDTGTGPVFTINYTVDMSAPTGACRILDPQQVLVASVANTSLDVDVISGDFCFTSPPPSQSSIPTLSEWGFIIFMTLVMGIGVITLLRRKFV